MIGRKIATQWGVVVLTGLIVLAWNASASFAQSQEQDVAYLVGGPLAGIELPPFPTQHGERPGHPGAVDRGTHELPPQLELYPGSVEHYRAYMFKYMPVRSFFDQQSQIRNWVASDLRGAAESQIETYAAPVYFVPRHDEPERTEHFREPVEVVRFKAGSPTVALDLGDLERGMYAVRVIGAVETDQLRVFRRPLYLKLRVNDGLGGEVSTYRMAGGYVDEFYNVATFYFHAPEQRRYKVELLVDEGSEVELLVHNITLDDALAGATRQALKTRSSTQPAGGASQTGDLPREQRWERDAAIWRALPPLNAQAGGREANTHHYHLFYHSDTVRRGIDGKLEAEIDQEHGAWELLPVHRENSRAFFSDDPDFGRVFLRNEKLGLSYTLDDLHAGRALPGPYPYPADAAGLFEVNPEHADRGLVWSPIAEGVRNRIHDYAPTSGTAAYSSAQRWIGEGDAEAARDAAMALVRYAYQMPSLEMANNLSSVARVPGALSRDLVARNRMTEAFYLPHYKLYLEPIETYENLFSYIDGNQDLADSIGRFVPWVQTPEHVIELIDVYLVQTTAKRIMRYHYHTHPDAMVTIIDTLDDSQVTADMRHWLNERAWKYPLEPIGLQNIAINVFDREGASTIGSTYYATQAPFEGTPKYAAFAQWQKRRIVAGYDFLRIGDVGGPDKPPGNINKGEFALDNRSRVVENWAGVLETGHEHDDHRLRQAAYLRLGMGIGHHHHDTLDLQVVAHGLPMTVDGGQRPGYATPADRTTRLHNVVEIDGREHHAPAWALTLADMPGAQYMLTAAPHPRTDHLMHRQVALIDVADDQLGDTVGKDRFANGYVVDVVRVTGGRQHTYAFHAMVNDQFESNIENESAAPDHPYLKDFHLKDTHFAGTAPQNLAATWRYSRSGGTGSEQQMLGEHFVEDSPRKYTRLHLLDVQGAETVRADADGHKWEYRYTTLYTHRKVDEGELASAFMGVIEPYAGDPFITDVEPVSIVDNEDDAQRAVAARIRTRPGHTDVIFADGRPEQVRQVQGMRVAGEFAYHSSDAEGLRQASLVGCTLLETDGLSVRVAERERTATITAVDYERKTVTTNAAWPATSGDKLLEIRSGGRTLSFTATRVEPAGEGSLITMLHGADYYRSSIESVDEAAGTVTAMGSLGLGKRAGLDRGWVATNEDQTRTWRADVLAPKRFQLSAGNVSRADFAPQNAIRFWEYGVGDELRQRTFVSLRRVEPGVYEVHGDVDVQITVGEQTHQITADDFAKAKDSIRITTER